MRLQRKVYSKTRSTSRFTQEQIQKWHSHLFRMSFDITSYEYDATRKLNKNQRISVAKNESGDTTKVNTQYGPMCVTLYDIGFDLNVYTAGPSDDGLRIIEQMIVFFQGYLYLR